ncbi:hypothetical protein NC651_029687 [Populus alba x Populus x berolinensis]|nr:hypothetical protein NC651_029687 [Populus alba x Populus x berolinensis]
MVSQVHFFHHLMPHNLLEQVLVVGVKKVKVIKRPVGDTSSQKSIMGGKKKKEIGAETNPARPKKRLATGKGEEVRSLIMENPPIKSLVLSPPSETEVVEVGGTKSLSSIGASDYSASEDAREKKAQRTLDTLGAEGKETVARQRAEGKQPVAQPPRKSVKPDSFKKTEPPVRAIEPT